MDDHLLQTLFVLGSVDGQVHPTEQRMIDALRMTVRELQGRKAPQHITRAELLAKLSLLDELAARRQCYVLALEVALASGTVNEPEQRYLGELQRVLRLDDEFARHAREILGSKYRL
jgi:uncharacterized membrane protein YebE (DUF533 family)